MFLTGLLKFLFWFFLISYILKVLGRYILPILLKRYIKKKQSQFNQQFNHQDSPIEKEGKVSIKTKPKKSKTDTNDMGDYVDFEEVDD
jgi:hypothetical protein